jgi:hypothetical protein
LDRHWDWVLLERPRFSSQMTQVDTNAAVDSQLVAFSQAEGSAKMADHVALEVSIRNQPCFDHAIQPAKMQKK